MGAFKGGAGPYIAVSGRRLLDLLFPPPVARRRQRPEELLVAVEEMPPRTTLIAMGIQHALLALMFSLYAVLAAQSMGMEPAAVATFTSATILILGLGTVLQGMVTRFGAGVLLIGIPGPAKVALHVAVTLQYGLAATMGAMLVGSLMMVVTARFIPRLRAIFPPEVIGVVLLLLGVTLVTGGVSRSFGIQTGGGFSLAAMAVAGTTLACMVAIAVWGTPGLKRVAMAVGAAGGIIVAIITGQLDGSALAPVAEMPLLAVPVLGLHLPVPEFHPAPIAIFMISALLTVMDQFACALSVDKMDDADWRRADMGLVARAITCLGLTHLLHGLTGTLSGGTSSANIGLAHASGITARRVGIVAGLVMIMAAFVPPVAGLLAQTPTAVIGGILVYTAAYIIVTGMELIMSRMMNPKRSLTVGLSVVAGTAVMLLPQLVQAAPQWSQVIIGSGFIVGSVMAVLLNGLFRIGTARAAGIELPLTGEAAEAAHFLAHWGKQWGARRDVVLRAATAVGEATESLRDSGTEGAFTLQASFDEFNLACILSYRGRALRLEMPAVAPDAQAALDMAEDEMEAMMRQVSARLLRHLSDQIRSSQSGETASLRMVFYH